jgi:predicted permease
MWQNNFGGDPAIVGKSIEIVHHQVTVIGVAPRGFVGAMPGIREDAWAPLDPLGNSWQVRQRSAAWLNVIGRLRPGVTRESATQDLDRIMRQIVAQYPNDHLGVNTISLDPLWRSPFGANGMMAAFLPLLLAIAGFVLLLTCANVATLALVRFVSRRREIAIRQSLGAGRTQMMRQMMIEGLLVSLVGGAVASLLTAWTAKTFAFFLPPNGNPILLNGMMDQRVILGIGLMVGLAGALCGALPAWRSSRVPAAEVLKDETGNISGSSHNRRLLSGLVVAQIGLSLALLVAAGLFLRTLNKMSTADPGFAQDHVLNVSVGLAIGGYSNDESRVIQHKILDRVAAIQGVKVASLTDWVPFSFSRKTANAYREGYAPKPHESLEVRLADVTAGYFASLEIPQIEGRDFTRDDDEHAPLVVILDQTAAHRYFPGQNPLGQRLSVYGRWLTVVGVVKNSKHQFVNEAPEPMIFLPFFQIGEWETIVQVRTQGDPESMAPAVEEAIRQVNSQVPVFDVRPLRETTQISSSFAMMETTFASIFAVLALILAATGIYGVVAYRTQLRTHEIGIRVALGASRTDVLKLVLFQGMRLTVAGLVVGLALSLALTQFLRGLLYGVSATDPITVTIVIALLALIAVVACYLPARKAMSVDPVAAIRAQ